MTAARVRARSVLVAVLLSLAAMVAPTFVAASASAAPVEHVNPTPVYRFYKTTDGSHFFTNSANEKEQLQAIPNSGYRYEGIAYYAFPTQVEGTQPVYRFYKFSQGVHFFTINPQEAEGLRANNSNVYRYEGVAYYAYPSQQTDSTAVYRFYKFQQGVHFYTANPVESAQLQANASSTYRYEGVAYYVPTKLQFSSQFSTTQPIVLPTGVVRATLTTSGSGDFTVLPTADTEDGLYLQPDGQNEGPISTADFLHEGSYNVEADTDGSWSMTLDVLNISEGLTTHWSGSGPAATNLFTTQAGAKTFHWTYLGHPNTTFGFIILDQVGNILDSDGGDQTGTTGLTGDLQTTTALANYTIVVYIYNNDPEAGPTTDTSGNWAITMS